MVLSSGNGSNFNRLLMVKGYPVVWLHWEHAYHWDCVNNMEMMRIHHRLTKEHINVTVTGKMRNHLAEHVLDKDMLFLMKAYARTLKDPSQLTGTIEFLTHTSFIVSLFNNTLPLTNTADERLRQVPEVYRFFEDWVSEEKATTMTRETREDTLYLLSAFSSLSELLLSRNQSLYPSRINSDIVENFFCQQRSLFNGSNTNPTALQYGKTVNSILIGVRSTTAAKRSNTGGVLPLNMKMPKKQ